ncbi:MAG: adenosine kinase [Prevotellaceae bacterium]|jgi:sugar/nucleoside kinase (ribokinase family)|nr:adenosine kinase [Prevotellaceae bacterium]
MNSILGMGNALVDILVTLDDEALLKEFRLPRGTMQHVDSAVSAELWETVRSSRVRVVAGGSASNTLTGIAALGLPAAFVGKTGTDELGRLFADDQALHGVTSHLLTSRAPTGRCMVFITPDTERTMATFLGAAIELSPEDIQPSMFTGYTYFHIEGYLVQDHALIRRAVELAGEQNLTVSLDLSSYNVVEANKQFLADIIEKQVDIVFANEAEAAAFTGCRPAEAVRELGKYCRIAVVKVGSGGSLVRSGDEEYHQPAYPANAIDATGAGDLYAAGFLYAHACGQPLRQCGDLASLAAAKVVEVIGPRIDMETWGRIKSGELRIRN